MLAPETGPVAAPLDEPGRRAAPDWTRAQIQAAFAGERQAMAALVREVLPPIKVEVAVALVRQALPRRRDPRQDIDDFAHDVVLHLMADGGRVLQLWDPERGLSLAGFVRLVARQRVSRALQGHRGNPWSEDPIDQESVELLADLDAGDRVLESREELRGLLERLQAHLNPRGLILFHRIFVEQRPILEVAAELGMTREAVDAWNTRTRNLARKLAADAAPMPRT